MNIYISSILLFGYKSLKPIDLKIYLLLKFYSSIKGYAFPSQRLLADKVGVDIRTIQRSINRLRIAGLVGIVRVKRQNFYVVREPKRNDIDYCKYIYDTEINKVIKSEPILKLKKNFEIF